MRAPISLGACLLLLALPGCERAAPTLTATVATAHGERALALEIARTPAEQEKGLSGRKALTPRTGMLFPFDPPRTPSFWMKDTHVPLDLIFVRTDGTIAAILPGTPEDETPIAPGQPARAVIEIGGGEAARLGIAPGDRVRWGDCAAPGEDGPMRFCP